MVHQDPNRGTLLPTLRVRGSLARVPVWVWRLFMHAISKGELRQLNADPITGIRYWHDIDFVGDHIRSHRLDVMAPSKRPGMAGTATTNFPHNLPVYVYFHGGGWTSGDKASLTKYCAGQAAGGVVVVNVNYRMAPHFHLGHVLEDANAALGWVVGYHCTSANSTATTSASCSAATPPAARFPRSWPQPPSAPS